MGQIKRTKLYEEVMDRILEMIKANGMKVGDKLQSEKELSSKFGVSRMAIREALSALQAAGLIEVRHGSGIYLKDINENITNPLSLKLLTGKENLLHIMELRMGMESEAAYLTTKRADADEIALLEEILEQMSAEVHRGGKAHDEDFKFHRTLVRASRNPLIMKVYDSIANVFYDGLRSSHKIFRESLGPRLVILEEHLLILDCIKSGKAEAAREAMRVHLENVHAKLRGIPAATLKKSGEGVKLYSGEPKFFKEHTWVQVEDKVGVVGITDFAQDSLGNVVYIDLPQVGSEFKAGAVFGSIESVKVISDLYCPMSGKVIEVNEKLFDLPQLVNSDPLSEGWMIKLEISDLSELDKLMSVDQYKAYVNRS